MDAIANSALPLLQISTGTCLYKTLPFWSSLYSYFQSNLFTVFCSLLFILWHNHINILQLQMVIAEVFTIMNMSLHKQLTLSIEQTLTWGVAYLHLFCSFNIFLKQLSLENWHTTNGLQFIEDGLCIVNLLVQLFSSWLFILMCWKGNIKSNLKAVSVVDSSVGRALSFSHEGPGFKSLWGHSFFSLLIRDLIDC
jgi:hypothetical protein